MIEIEKTTKKTGSKQRSTHQTVESTNFAPTPTSNQTTKRTRTQINKPTKPTTWKTTRSTIRTTQKTTINNSSWTSSTSTSNHPFHTSGKMPSTHTHSLSLSQKAKHSTPKSNRRITASQED